MIPQSPPWAVAILDQFDTSPETDTGASPPAVPIADALALAQLTSPATVAALLARSLAANPGVDDALPPPLDTAGITTARTLNRFRRRLGEDWVRRIAEAGFDVMVMKGAASAHMIYQKPDDRGLSDVDILIRPDDLRHVCTFLTGQGCRFADMPTRSRWGFVSDASFQPLITPDGAGNIDLHIHPDAWPLHQALDADKMLARAVSSENGLKLPCAEHHFLVMASHAARDLFGANAMKGIVDGLVMLAQPDVRPDITRVRDLARQAGLLAAVDSFLTLLSLLGAPGPPGMPPASSPGPILEHTVEMIARLFPDGTDLPVLEKLKREFTIAAGPRIALARAAKRAAGLIRRSTGLPTQD